MFQVSQSQEGRGSKGDKCMFLLYIDASSVTNCKAGNDSASAVGIEFSIKDYYAIQVRAFYLSYSHLSLFYWG